MMVHIILQVGYICFLIILFRCFEVILSVITNRFNFLGLFRLFFKFLLFMLFFCCIEFYLFLLLGLTKYNLTRWCISGLVTWLQDSMYILVFHFGTFLFIMSLLFAYRTLGFLSWSTFLFCLSSFLVGRFLKLSG